MYSSDVHNRMYSNSLFLMNLFKVNRTKHKSILLVHYMYDRKFKTKLTHPIINSKFLFSLKKILFLPN